MSCGRARQVDLAGYIVDPSDREWDDFRTHLAGCAECGAELERWTVLEEGLRDLGPEAQHPADDDLFAFSEDPSGLPEQRRLGVETHLADCASCRDRVTAVAGFEFPESDDVVPSRSREDREPWLDRIGRWFGPVPQPAWVAALLLLVLAPLFWFLSGDAPPVAPPVAQVDPIPEAPTVDPEIQIASIDLSSPLLYSPPPELLGMSAARFEIMPRSVSRPLPRVQPLAPQHPGRTAMESPVLFWYLEGPTPNALMFQLVAIESDETVLQTTRSGPHTAGIQSIDLARHAVELQIGTPYRWYVSVLAENAPGPEDRVAGAVVVRSESASGAGDAHPLVRARALAAAGYWFDAFSVLSSNMQADSQLHARRAELLEQVGLDALAEADRAGEL